MHSLKIQNLNRFQDSNNTQLPSVNIDAQLISRYSKNILPGEFTIAHVPMMTTFIYLRGFCSVFNTVRKGVRIKNAAPSISKLSCIVRDI